MDTYIDDSLRVHVLVVSDELLNLVDQVLRALAGRLVLGIVRWKLVRQQLLHAFLSFCLVLHQLIEACVDVSEPVVHLVLLGNKRIVFALLQRDCLP